MFTDISGLLAHNPPGRYGGVAAADLDGDGRAEVVVAGVGGPTRVLRWDGFRLRDVVPPAPVDPATPAVALAAGDVDGDGREELYVHAAGPAGAADRLFRRTPDGHWDDLLARPENRAARPRGPGRGVAAVDRRGVGRYGFVVTGHGGPTRFVELTPAGTLADLAPALRMDRAAAGHGVLAAPLLSAHTDVLCLAENGPNRLYRNRGDGGFEECGDRLRLTDPDEHGRAAAAVDADGDGRLELCWGNADGPHRLMARRPDGTWKDRATPALAFPSAVRAVVAADFDNDGHDELLVLNHGEPNRLFRVTPGGEAGAAGGFDVTMLDPLAALDPDGPGGGAVVADVDGDGVLELLVAAGGDGPRPLALYRARAAAGNGWLRVAPRTRFGAPARGALVRIEVAGRVRAKCVCGGGGPAGQGEPVAHFGLGRGPGVARVTVTWPDGTAMTIDRPGVNRTLTVPYPRG